MVQNIVQNMGYIDRWAAFDSIIGKRKCVFSVYIYDVRLRMVNKISNELGDVCF